MLDQGTYKTGQRAYNALCFFVGRKKSWQQKNDVVFKQVIAHNFVGRKKCYITSSLCDMWKTVTEMGSILDQSESKLNFFMYSVKTFHINRI